MAEPFDLDRAEVDGKHVEGGLGGALQGGDEQAGVAVRADGRVVEQRGDDGIGPGPGQGPHQGHGQGLGRQAEGRGEAAERAHHQVEHTAGAQHGHAHQDDHHVGDDAQGHLEPLTPTLNHHLVDPHPAHCTESQKQHDQAGDDPRRQGLAVEHGHRHQADQRGQGKHARPQRQGSVLGQGGVRVRVRHRDRRRPVGERGRGGAQATVELGCEDGHRGRADGGEQGGGQDGGRVGGAGRGAQGDHARGQEGDRAGVDRQEQDHGVRGRARLGVQLVQLLHGADAERRGRVAQAQGVGRKVEDHRAHGRVIGGHVREQPDHERPDEPGEQAEQAAGLGHLHQPEKQGHHPHQADGQGDRARGGLDDGRGQQLHGRGPARGRIPDQLVPAGEHKGQADHDKQDGVHALPRVKAPDRWCRVVPRAASGRPLQAPLILKRAGEVNRQWSLRAGVAAGLRT